MSRSRSSLLIRWNDFAGATACIIAQAKPVFPRPPVPDRSRTCFFQPPATQAGRDLCTEAKEMKALSLCFGYVFKVPVDIVSQFHAHRTFTTKVFTHLSDPNVLKRVSSPMAFLLFLARTLLFRL